MLGHNGGPRLITDDTQAVAFLTGQAYRINQTVYEQRFPDWDFGRLVFVDTTGPAWGPGVLTYFSSITGAAKWQSAYAKDVPLADVAQDMSLRNFHLAAIGYQYNLEEINTAIQIGAPLDQRRARAARMAYMQFMWNLVLTGDATKNLGGLINYAGVVATAAPNDGTGSARHWVSNAGVGTKTPAQIVRDINIALTAIQSGTNHVEFADTVLLPLEAFNYIASTPYSTTTMETILSFVQKTNIYTLTTGRPLTIRTVRELRTASTETVVGGGRMVAYKNDQNYVKVHLPMPHQFLPVYQDGPMNWQVPGIFRTGGLEMMTTLTARYIDGILEVPA